DDWNRIDYIYDAYTTSHYNYTEFQRPPAEFSDVYSDYGEDTDGDGLYNYLTIEVGVNVTTAGYYQINGELYDSYDDYIGWGSNYTYLDAGDQTVQLDFDGIAIRQNEVNGTYNLKYLNLYDDCWHQLDYIYDAYTTSYYNYTEFEEPRPDAYEPDDNYSLANYISVDGTKQTHNVHIPGDHDWLKFNATSDESYTIETSDLGDQSDTYLYLYATDGTTEIDHDDDGGTGLASKIVWDCSISGTYYVMIRHCSSSAFGPETKYNISVTVNEAPTITFVPPTPANNSEVTVDYVFVKVTLNENGNTAILNWNGVNETMFGAEMNFYLNKTGLSNGNYTFKVYASDTSNNWNVSETRTVRVTLPDDTVTRDLPDSASAGATVTVNLTVDVESGATFYAIDETVPTGWTVTSATSGGDYTAEAGHVKWVVTSGAADTVYSYTVLVPADASGTYTFDGIYMFEGMTAEATILGDVNVTVAVPVLTTIIVDPAVLSIDVGGTQIFTTTTLDQYGDAISTTVTWDSSNTAVGTIDANTGVFTAVAAGTTTVIATSGSVNGTAAVAVSEANMTVSATPETINVSEATDITINVTDASTGAAIDDASVTLEFGRSVIASGTTVGGEYTAAGVNVTETGTINVSVTASGYNAGSATVTVGEETLIDHYDADNSGDISKDEAITAIMDYFDDKISKDDAIEVIMAYFG
ncbi:hypothetical protein DRN77_02265, partial [Methanosarcinales archaeon]